MKLISISAALVLILAACSGNIKKVKLKNEPTIIGLFAEANAIDSLVLLYFTDKVNFRYYTFSQTTKKEDLAALRENLSTITSTYNSACKKDGTIYGYINGQIYTTFYFNMTDSCRGLRLYKNGVLYNYPINDAFLERLRFLKTTSVNP